MKGKFQQNAASHLELYCLLIGISLQEWKITPDAPKNENGLIVMIRMGKSTCHKDPKFSDR